MWVYRGGRRRRMFMRRLWRGGGLGVGRRGGIMLVDKGGGRSNSEKRRVGVVTAETDMGWWEQ